MTTHLSVWLSYLSFATNSFQWQPEISPELSHLSTVDAPSISTSVPGRTDHTRQRTLGQQHARRCLLCYPPELESIPSFPFVFLCNTHPFFPISNIKYSTNVFMIQTYKRYKMGILLLMAGGRSASMPLFFAALHKLPAPSGKEFDSSMLLN